VESPALQPEAIATGVLTTVRHGDLECRFAAPVEYVVRPGWADGMYVCALADPALAVRLRDRHNHGRGSTPAGATKSLARRLLRLASSEKCPSALASLVEYIGPCGFSGRVPVTDMLRLAVLAQWMCIDPRRYRAWLEVSLHQPASFAPAADCALIRLDAVFLERKPVDGRPVLSIGVEVKSSRADFSADRKHASYRGRVDRLYFAAPPGVVQPDELPRGVGLLELRREPGQAGFFDVTTEAWDFAMDPAARYDLMYGLALNRTEAPTGLDLYQQALHAVDEYWARESGGHTAAAAL
jgi:hypothetical protein